MNIMLIVFSTILIIASLHAYYRDRIIKFDKISKPAKYIFIFYLLFFTYTMVIGTTKFISEYTFFIFAFGIYVLMSGNIIHYIKQTRKKEY